MRETRNWTVPAAEVSINKVKQTSEDPPEYPNLALPQQSEKEQAVITAQIKTKLSHPLLFWHLILPFLFPYVTYSFI